MTIAAFVIDTSESMSAKTASGCSLMDHAKNVVEQMTVKKRQTPTHYVLLTNCLLLTSEDWPSNVKTSWTDWGDKPEKRAARFQEQLKKLAPAGENAIAPALGKAFDLLGQHRLRTGVDTWGKGRSPWCTEPGAVILITDGKNAFANIDPDQEPDDSDPPVGAGSAHPIHPPHVAMGVGQGDVRAKQQHQALNMNAVAEAASSAVGSELCGKPFRWDQRLFTLMIGAGGVNDEPPDLTGPAAMALKAMCEETGGYLMTWDGRAVVPQQMQLKDHVGELMHRLQKQGPVVMFRPEGEDTRGTDYMDDFDGFNPTPPPAARAGLIVRSNTGVWPIPEPFWMDRQLDELPCRLEAQPEIVFRRVEIGSTDPAAANAELLERLGVTGDHYELDWCGKGVDGRLDVPRSATWPLFVTGSGQSVNQEPFGYLRSSQTPGKTVMVILPYNYPDLGSLLQQRASTVQVTGNSAPPSQTSIFGRDFMLYMKGVPVYYHPLLWRALQPFGVHTLIIGDGLQSGGGVFNRRIIEKLQSLKDLAGRQVERADRIERARRAAQADQKPLHQQDAAAEGGGGGPASSAAGAGGGSKNAFRIPVGELLAQWEGMRASLFGTGGATVKGLYGAALARPRRRQQNIDEGIGQSGGKGGTEGGRRQGGGGYGGYGGYGDYEGYGCKVALRSPVLGSVAESLAPALTTVEMSDFASRMQGVEIPRDPLGESDGDDNQSGFRRLMANTTFESPFAKKKPGFSPLGLDEAANESAILDVTADDKVDEAKKVDTDSTKDAATISSSSSESKLGTPEGSASSSSERDLSPAHASFSTVSLQDATAVGSNGSGNVCGSGTAGNGNGSSNGNPRRQLPALVAVRGRRKFRKDVAAAGRAVGVTRPSSPPSPGGMPSNSNNNSSTSSNKNNINNKSSSSTTNTTNTNNSAGDSMNDDTDDSNGAAKTMPLVNSGTSSSKVGGEKPCVVLVPPNSPALAAPQTPDYPPPLDHPLYAPPSPMAPNDAPGSPVYRPNFLSDIGHSRVSKDNGYGNDGSSSAAKSASSTSPVTPRSGSAGRPAVDKVLDMGIGVIGEDPGSPERVEYDVLAGSGSFELPPVAATGQAEVDSQGDDNATRKVSGSEASIRRDENNGKDFGGPDGKLSPPPHARTPAARPPPSKQLQPPLKARPAQPLLASKPRPPPPRPPPPRSAPSSAVAGALGTMASSTGVRSNAASASGIQVGGNPPTSPMFTPTASPATLAASPVKRTGHGVGAGGAPIDSSRHAPGLLAPQPGAKSSAVGGFTRTVSPATISMGPPSTNPSTSNSKHAAARPVAGSSFTRTESPATLSITKQSGFVRTESPATLRPAAPAGTGRSVISAAEGSGTVGANGGAGTGGKAHGADDTRAAKRPRPENQEQDPRRKLTPHDYLLPHGWVIATSSKERRDYFFNTVTKSSQWTLPEGSRPR